MAFCVPMFMKLTNAQKYYVQIYYTIFHSDLTINVEKYGQKFIYTPEQGWALGQLLIHVKIDS